MFPPSRGNGNRASGLRHQPNLLASGCRGLQLSGNSPCHRGATNKEIIINSYTRIICTCKQSKWPCWAAKCAGVTPESSTTSGIFSLEFFILSSSHSRMRTCSNIAKVLSMTYIHLPCHEMLHDGVVSHHLHQAPPSPHLSHPLTNEHSQDVPPISTQMSLVAF